MHQLKRRFVAAGVAMLIALTGMFVVAPAAYAAPTYSVTQYQKAYDQLDLIAVKGRAPTTGYDRNQFGGEVSSSDYDGNGCVTRDDILRRDLMNVTLRAGTCVVMD